MANKKITKAMRKEIESINEKIELVGELSCKISDLGDDIQDYLKKKYADEGYDGSNEEVITDPKDYRIAVHANECAMLLSRCDFDFGKDRLDPDGLKHDSKFYEPVYKHVGYFNDWEDIKLILLKGYSYALYMYKHGLGAFYTVDDDEVYRKSDMEEDGDYVYSNCCGLEKHDVDSHVRDEWFSRGFDKITPRDNCFVDIYVPIKKEN